MKQIRTVEEWEIILEEAKVRPILIMKFSMTCVSSVTALKEYRALETDLQKYLVIVQTSREVSNAIERDLSVRHESPQLLIMNQGRAVWQATHYKIKRPSLMKAIELYASESAK